MKTYIVYTYGGETTEVKADDWQTTDGRLMLFRAGKAVAMFAQWNHFIVKDPE